MFLINNIYWKLAFVEPNYPLLIKYDGNYSIGACDNLTRTIYINNTLTGAYWKIKFEEKKKITIALSKPLLIGQMKQ